MLNFHSLQHLVEAGLLSTHYFRRWSRAASFSLTSRNEHFSACNHALDETKSAGQCRVFPVCHSKFFCRLQGKNEHCKCASCWPFPVFAFAASSANFLSARRQNLIRANSLVRRKSKIREILSIVISVTTAGN